MTDAEVLRRAAAILQARAHRPDGILSRGLVRFIHRLACSLDSADCPHASRRWVVGETVITCNDCGEWLPDARLPHDLAPGRRTSTPRTWRPAPGMAWDGHEWRHSDGGHVGFGRDQSYSEAQELGARITDYHQAMSGNRAVGFTVDGLRMVPWTLRNGEQVLAFYA